MLPPQGRVVMVSGANRGIGLAVARCLYGKGYNLSLGGRRMGDIEAATKGWSAERVLCHRLEAGDKTSAGDWVAATVQRFDRIDGLVNNAGISRPVAIMDDDEAALDELWSINVKGPLRLTRLALPHLKAAGSGRIVNIASMSGKRVRNDHVGYAMSKFAVVALTHATRRLGWEHGVRATVVCPSFVATDMTDNAATAGKIARADMTQPEDLAEMIAAVMALPNNAAIAELLVNCRLEDMV
jgi:NADP-dependent 3-hydroxy acid dehydrogenase YdfG